MIQGGMLDDGQAQTRSTARFRTALVNAIETLKYLTLLLGRNTNSRIGNRQIRVPVVVGSAPQRHRTAGPVVANGVARQVIDELIDQARYALSLIHI